MRTTDYSASGRATRTAPYRDFAGNEMLEGDVITHPSGEFGTVYVTDKGAWRVRYPDGISGLLALQIDDRGMAIVRKRTL